MPKCSCSASFRSVLREDPDLKHPEQKHLRTGAGMTNKNEIEPVSSGSIRQTNMQINGIFQLIYSFFGPSREHVGIPFTDIPVAYLQRDPPRRKARREGYRAPDAHHAEIGPGGSR